MRPRLPIALLAMTTVGPATLTAGGPKPRVLADFDSTMAAPDGSEALARVPSQVTARRVPDGDGQALEFAGRHAAGGMAGVRITFLDARGRPAPVDASRHDYLTFRMRATGGASRIQVRIADGAARNEPIDAGEVTRYLPEGLSADWRLVAVPLGALGLGLKTLAGVTFLVLDPADFTFAVDDIALKREPEDALPTPKRRAGVPF